MDIKKLLTNLQVKGFKPYYFENQEDAINKILEIIPTNSTIGFGGSVTAQMLNLPDILEKAANTIYTHGRVKPELRDQVYQLAKDADWYISSTNALTEQGDFVNIDGTANRVSTLAFGPKNILYVLGTNKITPDVSSAINRIRNYVAPKNCVRLNKDTPCAKTGRCEDCNSPDCICNVTMISHHPTKTQKSAYVIIINKELGY